MTFKSSIAFSIIGFAAVMMSVSPAAAKGCNGVVDQFKYGCAVWDNNNGPQWPHYSGKPSSGTPAPANQPPAVVNRNGNGIISNDGASIVTNASSNMRNH